jgi:hypothetical protein
VSPVFSRQTADFRPSNSAFYGYNFDVSPGYFTAAGTPLLAGRDVSFTDTPKTPPVAIVNQEFARRLFQAEQAVGRYFKNSDGVSIQIVGIVADGKYLLLSEDPEAAVFLPISQKASSSTAIIVRTQRDTADTSLIVSTNRRPFIFHATSPGNSTGIQTCPFGGWCRRLRGAAASVLSPVVEAGL